MEDRLFEALDAEWGHIGNSQAARLAFRRWAAVEPALARFDSPAEALGWCRSAEPVAAAAVLRALVRQAGEPLAARAVLQAVVPSLCAQVARRIGGTPRLASGQAWEASEDFAADVIEAAMVRIAQLAGTSPPWPAQAICQSTWRSLRTAANRSARRGLALRLDEAAAEALHAGPSRSDAESLAVAVATAVRSRWLAPEDARVIFATRVLGHSPAEVAAAQGRDVRALRAQRRRAERQLVRAGWAPSAAMAPCHTRHRSPSRRRE